MRTDREIHGLRGPVKNVYVEAARFDEQEGRIAEKPSFSHTISFDEGGRLIEQVNRNPGGSEWRTVNDYSDSNKLLATRVYDPSGVVTKKVAYSYDDEGRLIAERHIAQDCGVTSETATYTYDSDGRKTKILECLFSGETSMMIGIEGTHTALRAREAKRVETRYDRRGGVVEVKVFNADGALVSRVEVTRDTLGNPLEETQYVGEIFPLGSCASDSCETGKTQELTEEQKAEVARLFSPNTPMSKHTHKYDAEGRLVESNLTVMGMAASRQTFTYDDAGNKSEETSYGGDGEFASKAIFTREYDEKGNWTKELVSTASSWDAEFGLSSPAHVTRRLITYW